MITATRRRRSAIRSVRRNWQVWLVWLVLGIGAIAMIMPFYWMVITSLKTKAAVMKVPPDWWPNAFTLDNYRLVWDRLNVALLYRNSLVLASANTVISVLTSALAGYVFAKFDFPGKNLLFTLILSSMMIPFNVVMIPLFLTIVRFHWANTYWALIIPAAFTSFGIFLMRQFTSNLPDDLIDAARMDGASEFRIFFALVLPLSTSPLAALGLLQFLGHWDDFLWPLIVLTDSRLFTLPIGLASFNTRWYTEYAPLLAGATLSVLPILVVFFLAQRYFMESIALQGLKI